MIKVARLADFPKENCFVKQFRGKTYEAAIDAANKEDNKPFTFVSYYEQEFGRNKRGQDKTIMVSYIVIPGD